MRQRYGVLVLDLLRLNPHLPIRTLVLALEEQRHALDLDPLQELLLGLQIRTLALDLAHQHTVALAYQHKDSLALPLEEQQTLFLVLEPLVPVLFLEIQAPALALDSLFL